MTVKLHPSGNTLDYTLDWSDYLQVSGAAVQSAVWAIAPEGPQVTGDSFTASTTTTKVGQVGAGQLHRLTCTMTPTVGEPVDRSIWIRGGPR